MSLQKWQSDAIDYMVNRCTNQDGLILFHYMGTGKTYTSLAAAAVLGHPLVLVVPKPLVSQWRNDYLKQLEGVLPRVVKVLTYETLEEWLLSTDEALEKCTLVMDEAHNLSIWSKKLSDAARVGAVVSRLVRFKKRLLLTGTPMYEDLSDMSIISNVAAGKVVVPINERLFEKKFFRRNWMRSLTTGYILPILQIYTKIIYHFYMVGGGLLMVSGGLKPLGLKDPGFGKLASFAYKMSEKLSAPVYGYVGKLAAKPLVWLLDRWAELGYIDEDNPFNDAVTEIFNLRGQSGSGIDSNPLMGAVTTGAADGVKKVAKQKTLEVGISAGLSISFYMFILPLVRMLMFPEVAKYQYLDVNALHKVIGPLINFYKFDTSDESFPRTDERVVSTAYSAYSSALFMRYTLSSMTPSDFKALGLVRDTSEVDFLSFDQADQKRFLDIGRMIGNACTFKGRLVYSDKDRRYSLSEGGEWLDVAAKYVKLKKQLSSRGDKKIVLYTNFTHCMKTLSAYLGDGCKVMRNKDSEDTIAELKAWAMGTKGSVLILDSRFSEGVSFNGMDEIHLLEPCLTDSQVQQAKARIVRFGSHPKGSRVNVRMHVATVNPLVGASQSVIQWAKERSVQFYTETLTNYNQSTTPDSLVHQRNEYIHANTEDMVNKLTKSIGKPPSCTVRKERCEFGTEIRELKKCK